MNTLGSCFLLSMLCLAQMAGAQPEVSPPKRVIWITVDALRADHLRFMGYKHETSPWFDELSEKSVCFTRAFSPANITIRSVPMYMTGKMQWEIFDDLIEDRDINDSEQTIAETFKEAGFSTWWITGNGNTSERVNLDQGIDHFYYICREGSEKTTIEDIIRLLEMEYQPGEGREFLYFHTMDVHVPYRPPFPYGKMFNKPYERGVVRQGLPYDRFGDPIFSMLPTFSETHDMNQEDIEFFVGLYDGAIRYTSDYIPRLLEQLQFDPDEDLLIVTSDHGEQFMEQGFRGHGFSAGLFEFHVPLMIVYNEFEPFKCDTPVSLLDLYPTLCALFGFTPPPGLAGENILPLLLQNTIPPRVIRAEGFEKFGSSGVIVADDWFYAVTTSYFETDPANVWPHHEILLDISNPYSYDVNANVAPYRRDVAETMNELLRKAHPRMAPFDRNTIVCATDTIPLGPNLLSVKANNLETACLPQTPLLTTLSKGNYHFEAVPQELRFRASAITPDAVYVLELGYVLKGGVMTVEILDPVSGKQLHQSMLRKHTEGRQIQRAVRAVSSSMEVLIRFTEGAKGDIRTPYLRQLLAPAPLPVEPQGALKESDTPTTEMTDEERARMEALGYF